LPIYTSLVLALALLFHRLIVDEIANGFFGGPFEPLPVAEVSSVTESGS
jgi:hypothetical protein